VNCLTKEDERSKMKDEAAQKRFEDRSPSKSQHSRNKRREKGERITMAQVKKAGSEKDGSATPGYGWSNKSEQQGLERAIGKYDERRLISA
jgi:hypothetical protein